jgi:hypothetical protein
MSVVVRAEEQFAHGATVRRLHETLYSRAFEIPAVPIVPLPPSLPPSPAKSVYSQYSDSLAGSEQVSELSIVDDEAEVGTWCRTGITADEAAPRPFATPLVSIDRSDV